MNYNLSVVDFLFVCLLIYACYRTVRPFWLTMGESQCMNNNTVAGILAFGGLRTGTGTQSIGRKWLSFTQQCKKISRQLLAAVLFDQTELWHFRFGNKTGKVLVIMNNTFYFILRCLVIILSRYGVLRNTHGPEIKISRYYGTDKKNVIFSTLKWSWDVKLTESLRKYLTDVRLC